MKSDARWRRRADWCWLRGVQPPLFAPLVWGSLGSSEPEMTQRVGEVPVTLGTISWARRSPPDDGRVSSLSPRLIVWNASCLGPGRRAGARRPCAWMRGEGGSETTHRPSTVGGCAGNGARQGQRPVADGTDQWAATTLIRPAFRDRGFGRITISTSWSSAVNRLISRSTEKPASL